MEGFSAVNMVNGRETDRSLYASLVAEIKHLRSLRMIYITHVNRSQNVVSDFLAKFARSEHRTVVWLGSAPLEVVDLFKEDCKTS